MCDGTVVACCLDSEGKLALGNIFKSTINDILKQFIRENFKENSDSVINIHRGQLSKEQQEFISSILSGEKYFEIFIEDFKYKIDYLVNMHQEYIIYFKDNNDILVKKIHFDENLTIDKIDTYSLNFSSENLKILNNYITEEAINEKNNVIHKSNSFRKNEKNIMGLIYKKNVTKIFLKINLFEIKNKLLNIKKYLKNVNIINII